KAWYFPIQHGTGLNMSPGAVLDWTRDLAAAREDRLWVGANLLYDLEFMASEGVRFRGKFFDVLWAAALLDEQMPRYDLDSVGRKWLNERKEDEALYRWIQRAHKLKTATREACARYIHTAPPEVVGPYAEQDTRLPLRLWRVMREELISDGLGRVAGLEMRLIPLLLEMRLRGVRVDLEAAHRVKAELRRRIAEMQDGLKQAVGQHVDVWAAESVAAALRRVGYHNFPITPKTGAPSFRKE